MRYSGCFTQFPKAILVSPTSLVQYKVITYNRESGHHLQIKIEMLSLCILNITLCSGMRSEDVAVTVWAFLSWINEF